MRDGPVRATDRAAPALPLAGLRVVEFTHRVLGPTCGMFLVDRSAGVTEVEPIAGARTGRPLGSGAGSLAVVSDMRAPIAGLRVATRQIEALSAQGVIAAPG